MNESDWRDGFLFLGNQLTLDFVNTRPIQDRKPMELLPDFDAVLRWFQAADLLSPSEADDLRSRWGNSAEARKATEAMRELREKLRTEILSWEHGGAIGRSTIDELNRLMAKHPMRTRLTANRREHSTQLWFERREPEKKSWR